MQLAERSGFVNEVYRFVGQEAVGYVFGTQFHGVRHHPFGVLHVVELLIPRLQSFQNANGFLSRGFRHINLLKPPHDALRFLHVLVVLFVGRRADETDVSGFQIGFEDVGAVQTVAARGS